MGEASPVTYHYPWQLDSEQSYLRGSEQTISDVMRIWQEEIDLCYGSKYEIHPKRIEIYGSTLEENKGTNKASKRIGYYSIDAEQYLDGLPVFGSIANNQNHGFAIGFTSDIDSNRLEEEMDQYRQGSQEACRLFLRTISTNGLDNRSMTELIDVRTMEYNDVPLASLEDVLGEIKEEIEKGHIRELYSIRLGYMLYSNPDMTDYAWAIPRWVIDCNYVTDENEEMVEDFHEMDDGWMNIWNVFEFTQMPVDAQTGALIIFTTGDKKTFSVPDIITWDDVQRAV